MHYGRSKACKGSLRPYIAVHPTSTTDQDRATSLSSAIPFRHLVEDIWLGFLGAIVIESTAFCTMDTFEDENPFENEAIQSTPSSTSRGDQSEPSSSPTAYETTPSSPPSSSNRPPFPSSGSHRLPQAYKSDYCCTRDQWLHSGEDVEILVRENVPILRSN